MSNIYSIKNGVHRENNHSSEPEGRHESVKTEHDKGAANGVLVGLSNEYARQEQQEQGSRSNKDNTPSEYQDNQNTLTVHFILGVT